MNADFARYRTMGETRPMRFAWSRTTPDDTSDDPATDGFATPVELAAVELLLDDGTREIGWIDTGGQRTSDWLNGHADIPMYSRTAGEDAAAAADGPPDPAPARATPLERDRIVWVVPPALPPNRHLRLHRRRVLVHLELDEHEVSGQAHVRPGADAIDQVLRGTRDLIPLTDVQLVSRADPGEGIALPVLIVNRRHVRRVVEDAPHASAPVPDPASEADPSDPRIAWLVAEAAPAPSTAGEDVSPSRPTEPDEPSGIELLQQALALLLDAGVIDVVEFQRMRARIPRPPA